ACRNRRQGRETSPSEYLRLPQGHWRDPLHVDRPCRGGDRHANLGRHLLPQKGTGGGRVAQKGHELGVGRNRKVFYQYNFAVIWRRKIHPLDSLVTRTLDDERAGDGCRVIEAEYDIDLGVDADRIDLEDAAGEAPLEVCAV